MTNLLLGFVGDLLVNRDDPHEAFKHVRDVLAEPDLLFGNLESAYTDTPEPVPSALGVLSAPVRNLDGFGTAGFDVMSLANNHIVDAGYAAMLDTRARLHAAGIRTCGAGANVEEAHAPAVLRAKNVSIAYLAYSSTFPMGYEARSNRPGLAPMRAYNCYRDPVPNIHEPGLMPIVTTVPDERDQERLRTDIARARAQSDLVIASFHWGDYNRPYRLTDHERRTARAAIDFGADLVVGHHHHSLRGIEWYDDKPIFYGLGHFLFDRRLDMSEQDYARWMFELDPAGMLEDVPYRMGPQPGWPLLPMHEDTRMTCLAWATGDQSGFKRVGFLPCRLLPDGTVEAVSLGSEEGEKVIAYMRACNETQRLNGTLAPGTGPTLAGFPTVSVVAKS